VIPTYDLAEIARTGGPRSTPPKPGTKFSKPGRYIETHRVRPIIAAWLHRFEIENDAQKTRNASRTIHSASVGSNGSRDTLASMAGVSPRLLTRILCGRTDGPSGSNVLAVETVDRLFCAMDCVALFYREPTNELQSDGFADVYFHAAIVGEGVAEEVAAVADLPVAWDECDDDPSFSKLRTWAA